MQKFSLLLEKYYKYLLAALIIIIPLYPKFPFLTIPGTYVSVRIEDFFLAGISVLLFPYLYKNLKDIFKRGIEKSLLLYLFVGAVSLLSAVLITKTVQVHIGALHLIRRIEYLVPFFLGVYAFRKKDINLLEFLIKTLMVTMVILAIYGIGQRYFSWPMIITQNSEYAKGIALRWTPGTHINSTFAGHYDLATFLVLFLPILVSLFFELKKTKARLIVLMVILGGFWLLISSVSRISIVSYLGGTAIALLILKRPKELIYTLIASMVLFSFSADLRDRYLRIFDVIKQKVGNVILVPMSVYAQSATPSASLEPVATPAPVVEDRSSSIRFNVEWPRAIRAVSKNPLLGTGYSSISLATDNDYLRALGETGLLGFGAFMLIFFRIGTLIFKNLRISESKNPVERAFLAGAVGAFPGILLNAVFIDIFEASKFAIIFWLFIGVLVGILRTNKNENNI